MGQVLKIGTKLIGDGEPVFIIAEAGVNHNGSLELAKKLVDVAVEAKADAVKFQTFTAETLVTATAPQADYQKKNIGREESQYAMLKRLELSQENHRILSHYAKEKNIIFLSTPFSEADADALESLGIPAFKIPSGEITNLPYLEHIARKAKPMLISTGMSTLAEVRQAIVTVRGVGNDKLVVLHCTSNYPASPDSLNLRVIQTMREELDLPVGYSDHSAGIVADGAAVALGACVIEKHFTLDKNMAGPDHKASLNPVELTEMVRAIRLTERMLGRGVKICTPEEESIRVVARKSLVARRTITTGEVIQGEDIIMKRPGTGISPAKLHTVVGRRAVATILADALIKSEDIA